MFDNSPVTTSPTSLIVANAERTESGSSALHRFQTELKTKNIMKCNFCLGFFAMDNSDN